MHHEVLATIDEDSGDAWYIKDKTKGEPKTPGLVLLNAFNVWAYRSSKLERIYCPKANFINCKWDGALTHIYAPLVTTLLVEEANKLTRIAFPLLEDLDAAHNSELLEIDCPRLKKIDVKSCPKLARITATAGLNIPNFSATPANPTIYLRIA